MLKFLENQVDPEHEQLVLLAPAALAPPDIFHEALDDQGLHQSLLFEVQRLRGGVYLEDGAIGTEDLTPDGRHECDEDYRAWHLLVRGTLGVSACVWFLDHDAGTALEALRVKSCPLFADDLWGPRVRQALANDLDRARRERLRFVELGGWAVDREHRHSGEALLLALAAYGLGRAFGGAIGLTTATVRHASSTILRRLGGHPVECEGQPVPTYFDTRYGCDMELLRFDSVAPNARYERAIDLLRTRLLAVPVIGAVPATETVRARKPRWRRATATAEAVA